MPRGGLRNFGPLGLTWSWRLNPSTLGSRKGRGAKLAWPFGASGLLWVVAAGPSWPGPLGPLTVYGSWPRGQVDLAPWGLWPSMDRGRGAKLAWPLGASDRLWIMAAGPCWPGPLGPLALCGSRPRGQVDLAPWGLLPSMDHGRGAKLAWPLGA